MDLVFLDLASERFWRYAVAIFDGSDNSFSGTVVSVRGLNSDRPAMHMQLHTPQATPQHTHARRARPRPMKVPRGGVLPSVVASSMCAT